MVRDIQRGVVGRLISLTLLSVLASAPAFSQATANDVQIEISYGRNVTVSIREDVRLRENNVYQGLRYREQRGLLQSTGNRREYTGRVMSLEETMRSSVLAAKRVERTDRVRVSLPPDGSLVVPPGQRLPRLRLVPSFPARPLSVGDEWASPGLWVGAAQRDAQPFTVLVNVAYRYRGVDTYEGRPAHVFEGGYRLEYPYSIDDESRPLVESTGFPSSTDDVSRLTGSHRLTVVVSADGSKLLLVRDVFTNEFALPDGSTRSEEGFTLMFWRTSTPVDDVAEIADAASSVADAAVDRVEEGVRITLSNLRFRPDTATMVAGERSKIDGIAAIIIGRPGRSVLVVGHTADVGRPRGQQELSLERARTVVDELIAAGVNPSRLLFEGRGGTEPLESNATEQGRARNRRVEIILLHDKL